MGGEASPFGGNDKGFLPGYTGCRDDVVAEGVGRFVAVLGIYLAQCIRRAFRPFVYGVVFKNECQDDVRCRVLGPEKALARRIVFEGTVFYRYRFYAMLGVEETVSVGPAIADDAVGKFDGVDGLSGIVGAKEAASDVGYGAVAHGDCLYVAV